jgi:hypothetical protein
MASSDSEDEVEYENELFNLRGIEFNVTTVAYMPISKLMKLQENASEISGQKLWCGSLVVIEYLLDHPEFIMNCNVLELGSGTGVVGMLCQKLGGHHVILSDYDLKSIEHMTADIVKNNVQCEILNLDWFSFDINQLSSEFLSSSHPLRLVAGDVLYKHALIQPFFTVIQQLLSPSRSSSPPSTSPAMLLCHVPRAGVEQNDIVTAAQQFGLSITSIPSDLWKKGVCVEYSTADDYDRAQLYLIESLSTTSS